MVVTQNLNRIIIYAQDEAERLMNKQIEPEHLLLAIIRLNGSTAYEVLHQTSGYDTTAGCSEHTHEGFGEITLADHEHHHEQSHAEGRAEVGQRDELIDLEVACERLVTRQGDNGRIIAQERHHAGQDSHAGQVIDGPHDGPQQLLQQIDHAELGEDAPKGPGQYRDSHQIEHGVQQQAVGCSHHGVYHVAQSHYVTQIAEDNKYHNEARHASGEKFGRGEGIIQN